MPAWITILTTVVVLGLAGGCEQDDPEPDMGDDAGCAGPPLPDEFWGDWVPEDLLMSLDVTHPEIDDCTRTITGTTSVHIDPTGRTAKSYDGLGITYVCDRSGYTPLVHSEFYDGRVTGCLTLSYHIADVRFWVNFLDIVDEVKSELVEANRPVDPLFEGEPLFFRFGPSESGRTEELGFVKADGTRLFINGEPFVRSSKPKDCECYNCGPSFRDPPRQRGCEYHCESDGDKICDCAPNFCPQTADWWDLYWLGCTCRKTI